MVSLFDVKTVSGIGLGTWQLGLKGWGAGYEAKELAEALQTGIKNGLNFIDNIGRRDTKRTPCFADLQILCLRFSGRKQNRNRDDRYQQ